MILQKSRKAQKVLLQFVIVFASTAIVLSHVNSKAIAQPTQPIQKEEIYKVADEMPQPSVDLSKFLYEKFKTPESAKNDTSGGFIVAQFVIGKDGKLRDAKIMKPLRTDIDQEVLRVINTLPDWKPARKDGIEVAAYYIVPFHYKPK